MMCNPQLSPFLQLAILSEGSSLCCRNRLLKLDFRSEALEIAVNDGHGQLLATTTIGDRATSRLGVELSVDLGFIPALGVTQISNAEIVLLGPKERHSVKPIASTEHVARGGLPLALGDDPVLDADSLAGEPVRPARDVAGREDARNIRFEAFVDRDAAVGGEARLFRQCDHRPYADADDDQIGL